MHIVICWDIKGSNPRRSEINTKLKGCLKGYSWVRPLSTFYVVKIASDAQRTAIKKSMTEVVSSIPDKVHFVISPTMAGGRYGGWLPRSMWDKLNKRSDP